MDLVKNIWVQTGFVGLFSVTGWVVAWFLYKENKSIKVNLIAIIKDNTTALTKLAERIK